MQLRGYTALSGRWGRQQRVEKIRKPAVFLRNTRDSVALLSRCFSQSLQHKPSGQIVAALRPQLSASTDASTVAFSSPFSAPVTHYANLQCLQTSELVCSIHPLEQLLRSEGPHEPWLPLLQETCRGLPIPKQRAWGGSYREIVIKTLPRPLRLELTETAQEGVPTAAAAVGAEEGFGAVSGSLVQRESASAVHAGAIPQEVLLGLSRGAKITHLLPVQQVALPLLLHPQIDVLLAGPARTGKSVAAALALVCHLIEAIDGQYTSSPSSLRASEGLRGGLGARGRAAGVPEVASLECIRALFITPTRDMAVQTRNLLQALGRYSGLRVEVLVGRGPGEGGSGRAPWEWFEALLHAQPHVVVCTPGKMEEFVSFMLAANYKGLKIPCTRPQADTPHMLSNCKFFIIEDAPLQLQEPSMMTALAKMKELLPVAHKSILLSSSLSWEVRGSASRLMNLNSFCLNAVEYCEALTAARLIPPLLPLSTEAGSTNSAQQRSSNWTSAALNEQTVNTVEASGSAQGPPWLLTSGKVGSPTEEECSFPDMPAPEALNSKNSPLRPPLAGGPCSEGPMGSCKFLGGRANSGGILHLAHPHALWGPKRSEEFIRKKKFQLGFGDSLRFPVVGCQEPEALEGMGRRVIVREGSNRSPEEFVLYPPELHAHFLFNAFAREAAAAQSNARAAEERGLEAASRRVFVFFNSARSLQFHYAFFKHYLFPNVNKILAAQQLQKTGERQLCSTNNAINNSSNRGSSSGRSSNSNSGSSVSSVVDAACFGVLEERAWWPVGAPLPHFFALHSRLSGEKRRAVVDAVASETPEFIGGKQQTRHKALKILFCTDVAAVGVQLGSPSLLLQVGAPKDTDLYVQRVVRAPRQGRKLLALSDLDGHFLFEAYKEGLPLQELSAAETLQLLQPNPLFAAAMGADEGVQSYRQAANRLAAALSAAHTSSNEHHAAGAGAPVADSDAAACAADVAAPAAATSAPASAGASTAETGTFSVADTAPAGASVAAHASETAAVPVAAAATTADLRRPPVPCEGEKTCTSDSHLSKHSLVASTSQNSPDSFCGRENGDQIPHERVSGGSLMTAVGPLVGHRPVWEDKGPLRASCELMYRSLLGWYAMQCNRLKYQKWQVPSFINAILLSFGVEAPAVTKQMAARLQLLAAPGLTVDYYAATKTELLACLPSCAGFRSRYRQLRLEKPLEEAVYAAYDSWGGESSPRTAAEAKEANQKDKGIIDLETCSDTECTDIPAFAKQKLYPPKVPWEFGQKSSRRTAQ